MFVPEPVAIAAPKLVKMDSGRDYRRRRRNPVAAEHFGHLLRRHDQVIDVMAQPPREPPSAQPQPCRGQPRQVVRRVFLEERMVALDRRHAGAPRQCDADLMRAKRRVDMDDVPGAFGQVADGSTRRSSYQPIFRIEEDHTRRQPDDLDVARPTAAP
jgi:hypothetical protein